MSKPHPLSIPIESLRPGTFTDGNNATWSFSEGDIADLAAGYDVTYFPVAGRGTAAEAGQRRIDRRRQDAAAMHMANIAAHDAE